jgi:hypothetical protein
VAVVDEQLLGTEAGASFIFSDDNAVRKLGYLGGKRYVRLTITPASNTGAWLVSAVAIKGTPRKRRLHNFTRGVGTGRPPVRWADASLDHISPVVRGGKNGYENLQLAHLLCNIKKAARVMGQLRMG